MTRIDLKRIAALYASEYRCWGDSPRSVMWPKGRQDIRFRALTRHIPVNSSFSLLDFGCGLADLRQYLSARFAAFDYTGVDIVSEFIEADRAKYPTDRFQLVRDFSEVDGSFDHIVASGVFNTLYTDDTASHRDYVYRALQHLFDRATVSLAVNFMTDQVDFMQPGAYHQNVAELQQFVSRQLSRRWLVDQSYMPYEFTIVVWKDAVIRRPENIFNGHGYSI